MRLCFGSFARVIKRCKKTNRTNVTVVELLLGLITDNVPIKNKDGNIFIVTDKIASYYLNCKEPVLGAIVEASSNPIVTSSAVDFFEDVILPEIDTALFTDLIGSICEIIKSDSDIPASQKQEFLRIANQENKASFLAKVYLYALKKNNKNGLEDEAKGDLQVKQALDEMNKLEVLLNSYPRPDPISPPDAPTEGELEYVKALLDVYSEELKMLERISIEDLDLYPEYKKDLLQHRKNYYAAEAIREGTKDCFGDSEENHFSALKEEIYDHIYSTYKKHFPSSMERLIEVMDRAALSPIERCRLLSKLNWISSREKKGVCHFLVKDGEISWTEK